MRWSTVLIHQSSLLVTASAHSSPERERVYYKIATKRSPAAEEWKLEGNEGGGGRDNGGRSESWDRPTAPKASLSSRADEGPRISSSVSLAKAQASSSSTSSSSTQGSLSEDTILRERDRQSHRLQQWPKRKTLSSTAWEVAFDVQCRNSHHGNLRVFIKE